MSLTPGWTEKSTNITMGHTSVFKDEFVRMTGNFYYLDNGSEYKDYPRTKEGWEALCEDLKGFEP